VAPKDTDLDCLLMEMLFHGRDGTLHDTFADCFIRLGHGHRRRGPSKGRYDFGTESGTTDLHPLDVIQPVDRALGVLESGWPGSNPPEARLSDPLALCGKRCGLFQGRTRK